MNRKLNTAIALFLFLLLPLNAFAAVSISGKVLRQGRTNHSSLITFKLKNPGEAAVVQTYNVTTASDGSYAISDVPAGVYNLSAKASNSLSQNQLLIEVSAGQATPNINFNLRGGDANNDNSVATADMIIMRKAWLSTEGQKRYEPTADFNGDKSIGTSDMMIMQSNWLKNGSEPQVTITSPQEGTLTSTSPISVSGTTDSTSVMVNGITATVTNNTFTAPGISLAEGQNRISAIATNAMGNKSADVVSVVFDTIAPVISNIAPAGGSSFLAGATINIQITATDADSDTLEYQFKIDGVEKQTWSASSTYAWTTAFLDVGNQLITCQVRDNLGNEASQDVNYCIENPTAQEVLQKVADNSALINNMKANMTLTATLNGQPFGDTDYCIYYFMNPNKEKTETYSGADRITKTDDIIIINGSNLYLVNPSTKAVNTIDLLSEANIASSQFIQMDICYNFPYFLSHTISRNDTATDLNMGLIAVDAIPNAPNGLYNKLEMQIDYKKGLIVKSLLYKDNNLVQTIETTESQQMPNGAWVPKVMVKTPVLSSGQLITTMTYDNISINTGLTNLDFDPNGQ